MKKYKFDVIIIGGGISGISVALELLSRKKNRIRLAIFDRGKKENFGGLAKKSFGGMFFSGSKEQKRMGISDSPDLAWEDWLSFAEYDPDEVYGKKWAKFYIYENLDWVYAWLKDKKIRFFPVVHWVERGLFVPGNSVPRFHMIWGTGYELIRVFSQELEKFIGNSLTIFYESMITHIHFDSKNQNVKGGKGIHLYSNELFQIECQYIVIASGGITGNIDIVKKFWGYSSSRPPRILLNGSHLEADGHLHFFLQKKGIFLRNLNKQWNYAAGIHHPFPEFEGEGLSLVPAKSALWVNAYGERIGSPPLISGYDTLYLVREIVKQPGAYSWHILNYKIALKELAVSGAEFNEGIRDKNIFRFLSTLLFGNRKLLRMFIHSCVDFVSANHLEELVEKINQLQKDYKMDVKTLQKTIQKYDAMILKGKKYFNDDQLRRIIHLRQYRGDRVRTCKFQRIQDQSAYPLIAIRLHIITRKSLGGIVTDLNSRVLNRKGKPIRGLYAVGESAGFGGGGIHGYRSLEGTFLGSCIFTGRIASKHISENI